MASALAVTEETGVIWTLTHEVAIGYASKRAARSGRRWRVAKDRSSGHWAAWEIGSI